MASGRLRDGREDLLRSDRKGERRQRQSEKRARVRRSRRSGGYGTDDGAASLRLFPCAGLARTLTAAAAPGRRTAARFSRSPITVAKQGVFPTMDARG